MFNPLGFAKKLIDRSRALFQGSSESFGTSPPSPSTAKNWGLIEALKNTPAGIEKDRNVSRAKIEQSDKKIETGLRNAVYELLNEDLSNTRRLLIYTQHFLDIFSIGLDKIDDGKHKTSLRKIHRASNKVVLNNLNKKQIEGIFERFAAVGKFQDLMDFLNDESNLMPISLILSAKKWDKKRNAKPVEKMPAASGKLPPLPPIERQESEQPGPPPEPAFYEEEIQIIELDDLLPEGEGDNEEIIPSSKGGYTRGVENTEIRTQPRIEWILDALKNSGFKNQDLLLYREKHVEGYNPGRNSYQVIEAQNEKHHFQIAVSEIVGNTTYIIRNPIDFTDGLVITISDLKKDPAVFQANCYTETQWLRNIRHYAYTPLEDLKIQLKTRIGWSDKKEAVEDSFGQFYLETFQIPKTTDNSIIEHGALAGKTTWARLYHALNLQTITGLEGVRNFKELRDHIFGAENNDDIILSAQPPAKEINARDVFHAAILAIKETGSLKIDPAVEASFRQKKVTGLEYIVGAETANKLNCASDFFIASGIVKKGKGGKLVPAPAEIINQLARLVGNEPTPPLT